MNGICVHAHDPICWLMSVSGQPARRVYLCADCGCTWLARADPEFDRLAREWQVRTRRRQELVSPTAARKLANTRRVRTAGRVETGETP